jgi:hypothetical protein
LENLRQLIPGDGVVRPFSHPEGSEE